ncbi:MAG TPA: hypothetical protein VG370_34910 [Chloroflexota bacterium]|nr:hypothetical protein [Chloroflexota bacterium]
MSPLVAPCAGCGLRAVCWLSHGRPLCVGCSPGRRYPLRFVCARGHELAQTRRWCGRKAHCSVCWAERRAQRRRARGAPA